MHAIYISALAIVLASVATAQALNRYQHNATIIGAQSNPFKSSGGYTIAVVKSLANRI